MRVFEGPGPGPTCLLFSPTGEQLALACPSGIHLLDAGSGAVVRTVPIGRTLPALAFTPDGQALLVDSAERVEHLSLPGGVRVASFPTSARRSEPPGLAVLPGGGAMVLTGRAAACLRLDSGAVLWFAADSGATASAVVAAPDQPLVAFRRGHALTVHETSLGRKVAEFPEVPGGPPAFGTGGVLAAVIDGHRLFLWRLDRVKDPPRSLSVGPLRMLRSPAFSPDGRLLAAACSDGRVYFWNTRDAREVAAFDFGIESPTHVTFAPDGLRAACAGEDGRVVVWDVA